MVLRVTQSDCCQTGPLCCSDTANRDIAVAQTVLAFRDYIDGCKMRFGIGRMDYSVKPGLYAAGKPNKNSPVFVGANYKLSFDVLRKNISGLDSWLLILDTKGINVWCAAGKGTFGTEELAKCIKDTRLVEIVNHRRLVLPQLGASGVNSNEVSRRTGFSVVFGPVRARDVKRFIAGGYYATPKMRTVEFTMLDRLVLIPVELVSAAKASLFVFGAMFLINLFATRQFGVFDFVIFAGAVITGTVLMPLLLPVVPGRAFAWKGWLLGLIWSVSALWLFGWLTPNHWLVSFGYLLLLPAISAYLAMNFTGASTFASPSGVLREMQVALPLIISASVAGTILVLISSLTN